MQNKTPNLQYYFNYYFGIIPSAFFSCFTHKKFEGAESLTPQNKKSGCSIPKGLEQPLALLYNLIATKNLQESEVIIQQ